MRRLPVTASGSDLGGTREIGAALGALDSPVAGRGPEPVRHGTRSSNPETMFPWAADSVRPAACGGDQVPTADGGGMERSRACLGRNSTAAQEESGRFRSSFSFLWYKLWYEFYN